MDADTAQISALVTGVTDNANRRLTFPKYWVEGAMPDAATRKRYGEAGFELHEEELPVVEGNTATGKVVMTTGQGEPQVLTWTFEKVGQEWKIKSAPLP